MKPEKATATVVDVDVAVPDLEAERVVAAQPLEDRPQDAMGQLMLECLRDAALEPLIDHAVDVGYRDELLAGPGLTCRPPSSVAVLADVEMLRQQRCEMAFDCCFRRLRPSRPPRPLVIDHGVEALEPEGEDLVEGLLRSLRGGDTALARLRPTEQPADRTWIDQATFDPPIPAPRVLKVLVRHLVEFETGLVFAHPQSNHGPPSIRSQAPTARTLPNGVDVLSALLTVDIHRTILRSRLAPLDFTRGPRGVRAHRLRR